MVTMFAKCTVVTVAQLCEFTKKSLNSIFKTSE